MCDSEWIEKMEEVDDADCNTKPNIPRHVELIVDSIASSRLPGGMFVIINQGEGIGIGGFMLVNSSNVDAAIGKGVETAAAAIASSTPYPYPHPDEGKGWSLLKATSISTSFSVVQI